MLKLKKILAFITVIILCELLITPLFFYDKDTYSKKELELIEFNYYVKHIELKTGLIIKDCEENQKVKFFYSNGDFKLYSYLLNKRINLCKSLK